MNVEAPKATVAEGWSQLEGQVANDTYPLRRFLGASGHSAVFLTETRADDYLNAAIKLVPAAACNAEAQLGYWQSAQGLTHPHLLRLLDSGRCELGGTPFLYVVMEYADETLSQILPIRALDPEEVRELLSPTLDVLAYLHRQNLVHGQLRPSNFLVVNDTLKLASDTIRGIGQPSARLTPPTLYDAPEATEGRIAAAGDIWGLGIVMVEALTQYPPATVEERTDVISLPASVPPTFVYVVRQCLNRNPANRPTVADLEGQINRAASAATALPATSGSVAAAAPVPGRPASEPSGAHPATLREKSSARMANASEERSGSTGVSAVLVIVAVLALIGAGWYLWRQAGSRQVPDTAQAVTSDNVTAPSEADRSSGGAALPATPGVANSAVPGSSDVGASPPAAQAQSTVPQPSPAVPAASSTGHSPGTAAGSRSAAPGTRTADTAAPTEAGGTGVLREEMPTPSRSALETIHGHIKISVRVTVDAGGNVTSSELQVPGPSPYFSRQALTAAGKWKFVSGSEGRQWLLHFDFSRDGVNGHATGG